MAGKNNLILESWKQLATKTHYQNTWICDETWFRFVELHYPALKNAVNFSRAQLNRVLSKHVGPFSVSNSTGIYMKRFQTSCPYTNKKRAVSFYYCRSSESKPPAEPSTAFSCADIFAKSHKMQNNRHILTVAEQHEGLTDAVGTEVANQIELRKNSSKTPNHNKINGEATEVTPVPTTEVRPASKTKNNQANSMQLAFSVSIYWESREAANLFGFNYDEEEDVYQGLKDRIHMLGIVVKKPNGYKNAVEKSDEFMSDYSIFTIRNKCIFLRAAYEIAIQDMGKDNNTWICHCCKVAVKQVNLIGIDTTINANTLSHWNIQFRKTGQFPHPNPYVANGLKPKPMLFEYFPRSAADSNAFILQHLDHFAVEMLRSEIISQIIPGLVKEVEKDGSNIETLEYQLLKRYEIKPPSYTTVRRWVHYLGFK